MPTAAASTVLVASSARDARAAQAMTDHHTELSRALAARVEAVLSGGEHSIDHARQRLVEFCQRELVPHAAAEETTLYPVAATVDRASLLVEAMVAEHGTLARHVSELEQPAEAAQVAARAGALHALFASHLAKEEELLVPLVAADPALSLAQVLDDMQGHLTPSASGCGHDCQCGADDASVPVLDARTVPHAIRHATVLGALSAVPVGGSLVLVAGHDPLPLLAQIEAREPGAVDVWYETRGPEAWRLHLTRTA